MSKQKTIPGSVPQTFSNLGKFSEINKKFQAPKRAKNTKKAVLALFWAYVGQPDGHIG